jgi:purine-binding chemotaxis protein CheW
MSADLPDELQDVEVDSPSESDGRDPETERADDDGEPDEVERFVVFAVGDRHLAVSVDAVKSIVKPSERTRVPRASGSIDGITELRGEITAIIDARSHFPTRSEEPPSEQQRVIVFDMPSDRQAAGIRVDSVEGVELYPLKYMERGDESNEEAADHPLVAGVLHRVVDGDEVEPIGLVDVGRVIEASRQRVE